MFSSISAVAVGQLSTIEETVFSKNIFGRKESESSMITSL
jgi:hypothetical protein